VPIVQSPFIVQIKSSFLRSPVNQSPLVIGIRADLAAEPEPDNDANFGQQWELSVVSAGTYTFKSRLISQPGCLKVADTTSPSSFASTVLGSCSSPRAKWSLQFRGGPGDLLVNTSGTGHALSPSQCLLGACEHRVTVVPEAFISNYTAMIGWSFDYL